MFSEVTVDRVEGGFAMYVARQAGTYGAQCPPTWALGHLGNWSVDVGGMSKMMMIMGL